MGNQVRKTYNRRSVIVDTWTWNKDSSGLFDYESKSPTLYKHCSIKTSKDGKLQRDKEDIVTIGINPECKDLLMILKNKNNYIIYNAGDVRYEEGPWKVLKRNNEIHVLKEGDVIKIGKLLFRVKDIFLEKERATFKSSNTPRGDTLRDKSIEIENGDDKSREEPSKDASCRFCLHSELETEDILIDPCNCKGSQKYVHVTCLQSWLRTKVSSVEITPYCSQVGWTDLYCKVCKSKYPEVIVRKKKKISLISFNNVHENYFMMETIRTDFNTDNEKIIYMISFEDKNELTFGRANDVDVRINDISISRVHAKFVLQNQEIGIQDFKSKFGTLLKIKLPHIVCDNDSIQIGKTLLIMRIVEKVIIAPACIEKLKGCNQNSATAKDDEESDEEMKIDQEYVEFNLE